MIDVCFSDSLAGVLCTIKDEIKSDGIFALPQTLNCGPLDCEDIVAQQIKVELEYEKYFRKDVTEEEIEKEFKNQLKEKRKTFQELKKHIDDGQKIRIWVSNQAKDRCGLFFFCYLMGGFTNELSAVVCPGYEHDDIFNETTEKRSWSSYSNPYFVAECVNEARVMCEYERRAYSTRWKELVKENAPLRILIDDVVVSVEEDFFDNAILGFVGVEPKHQNSVMGKMLGKWQCGDIFFISKRIERLIENGKIKVCEDRVANNGCYWGRTIALA